MNWLYNELQQVGVDFSSQAEVEAYDQKQGSNSPEACRDLLERLGVSESDRVLEFGTATGNLTIEAAKRCKHAYGVDVSLPMLEYARAKAKEVGLDNATFIRAGFLSYEHAASPVDFIVTKFALHHLSDFWKARALLNIAASLKIGGRLYLQDVIFSFAPQSAEQEVEAWIRKVTDYSGFSRAEFETHVRDEYSTFDWVVDGLLERTGFKILEKNVESPTYAEYICERVS